ncbi:MAG: hypothetical protein FWC76_05490 [Defluviitaleaceae bacterium]|nr:hypothetical protein [Defluviitaleaceae bacterium]
MDKCIYTLKNIDSSQFLGKEHIIPACIGGKQKLPQGYVSDEANNMFSKFELEFARNSIISAPRMICGPGKRGKIDPKKATKSNVHVMLNETNGQKVLGYMQLSKQYIINQVHIKDTKAPSLNTHFTLPYSDIISPECLLAEFHNQMKLLAKFSVVIRELSINDDEYILGFYDGKWHFAISENCTNINEECNKAIDYVKWLVEQYENKNYDNINSNKTRVPQYQSQIKIYQDMDKFGQVIAKSAFNYLAFLKGNDYVLNELFNPIRLAIYTGININNFAKIVPASPLKDDFIGFIKSFESYNIGRNSHFIVIMKVQNYLIAAVSLYGILCHYFVELSNNYIENDFDEMKGFICDWENGREFDLNEFHKMSKSKHSI